MKREKKRTLKETWKKWKTLRKNWKMWIILPNGIGMIIFSLYLLINIVEIEIRFNFQFFSISLAALLWIFLIVICNLIWFLFTLYGASRIRDSISQTELKERYRNNNQTKNEEGD
ncbi:MAG: hypothetical protein GF317_20770 [Candidatus Lokiarchaeota archaeon]|nr:hypothetical protein [Candidatus Lokiarchaeota archaeon]